MIPFLFLLVFPFLVFSQSPSRIAISKPQFLSPDSRGGVYINAFQGQKPAIFHFSASGQMSTLITEDDVHEHSPTSHSEEEGEEFVLLHTPSELWMSGDGQRLIFPAFRHVHPRHIADVMMYENGKISKLLPVDHKLRYQMGTETHERYMIHGLKASLLPNGYYVTSYLAKQPALQNTPISAVLYHYRPMAGSSYEMTAFADMDYEDRDFSVTHPGCMSTSSVLFALGIPPVTFFQPTSYTLFRSDAGGRRQSLAAGVNLTETAFACAGEEASAFYRDSGGRTHLVSVTNSGPRTIFSGNTMNGAPVGDISHHHISDTGLHYFLMKNADGRQGVYSINRDGAVATVLAPGFAGNNRVVRHMAVSGPKFYFVTDIPNAEAIGTDAQMLMYPPSTPSASRTNFTSSGVVNAASFQAGLAPGGIGAIFGEALAPSAQQARGASLPFELGTVKVLLDGNPAPIFFVSPGQINFQVPWELGAPASVKVSLLHAGVPVAEAPVALAPVALGIFRDGAGGAYIVTTADYRLVNEQNPCRAGDPCIIWATGMGRTNKAVATGQISPAGAETLEQPELTINGKEARIQFAGLSPGLIGVNQINFVMPSDVTAASIENAHADLHQGPGHAHFRIYTGR